MSSQTLFTVRQLHNCRKDRLLLEHYNEKLGAYEKTLNPLFDTRITIMYNSPWRALRSSTVGVFVVEQNGEPVGYILGKIKNVPAWWRGGRYGYIECLYVDEAGRGQGVATMLFETLKTWFAQRGITTIMLRLFHNNEAAQALYRKWGFAPFIDQLTMQIGTDYKDHSS